jgi:hypothetical protein
MKITGHKKVSNWIVRKYLEICKIGGRRAIPNLKMWELKLCFGKNKRLEVYLSLTILNI